MRIEELVANNLPEGFGLAVGLRSIEPSIDLLTF